MVFKKLRKSLSLANLRPSTSSGSRPGTSYGTLDSVPASSPPPVPQMPDRSIYQHRGPPTSHGSADSSPISSPSPMPAMPDVSIYQHANTSTSNLSTTSTLYEQIPEFPVPPTYHGFMQAARREAERRQRMEWAWMEAERRRREAAASHWPNDPWRGGFGPPAQEEPPRQWKIKNGLWREKFYPRRTGVR